MNNSDVSNVWVFLERLLDVCRDNEVVVAVAEGQVCESHNLADLDPTFSVGAIGDN